MSLHEHIHCIGIGGIGISAIARYYLARGYRVTGTNMGHSPLLDTLAAEGIEIVLDGASVISENTKKVIYTEAIIDDDALWLAGVRVNHTWEIEAAKKFNSQILSYPEALAEVFQTFPMKIAVAGAHGKSTTSAMIGTVLHDLHESTKHKVFDRLTPWSSRMAQSTNEEFLHSGATTITGTLVKSFGWKNICIEGYEIMNIEACEYRNAFLNYHPDIAVITNIDPDHLDFFKTEENYFAAFETFISQSRCVVILASELQSIKFKVHSSGTIVIVHPTYYELVGEPFNDIQPGKYPYDLPKLLVPGEHIRLDASLAFAVGQLLHLDAEFAKNSLAQYPGSWRRMEIIKTTESDNIIMSDYGHHPTEIRVTLSALRAAYPHSKIIVFFEPHQYSRTYELADEFATSFQDADMTYISDIYAARDIDERRDMITSRILADKVAEHSPCEYIGTLTEAGIRFKKLESEKTHTLFLLLWAGNIDQLRDTL